MTTQEKQAFLFTQIIEAGLDAEAFQLLLENRNPEAGLDIEKWSMKDLQKVVKEFKGKEQSGKTETKSPEKIVTKAQEKTEAPKTTKPIEKQPISKATEPNKPTDKEAVPFGKRVPIKKEEEKPALKSQTKPTQAQPKPKQQKPAPKSEQAPPRSTDTEQKKPNKKVEAQFIAESDEYNNIDKKTKEQIFSRSIPCQRPELSKLFNLDVQVEISKYEKVQGGMFQQTYVIYTVNTPSQGWTVPRRYNDFVWLRETLQKLHPGLPIPPIAKKGTFRKFEDPHLVRRMIVLESFLNRILTIPQLKGESIIENFLKLTDNVEYLKFKKAFTIEEDKIQINKIKNLRGSISLVIEPKINKFIQHVKQNISYTEPRLRKIFKESKALFRLAEGGSNLLQSISKTFQELSQESSHFNKATDVNIKTSFSLFYDLMKDLTSDMAKIMINEADLIKKYLYGVYKYETMNLNSMLDYIQKLESAREQYQQYKAKLNRTKEKLLEDRNYSKWGMSTAQTQRLAQNKDAQHDKNELMGMMLPKETETEVQLKQYYAFVNFQFYEEASRWIHATPKYLSNILMQMNKKQNKVTTDRMMLWADLMASIMSFQEGRRVCSLEINAK